MMLDEVRTLASYLGQNTRVLPWYMDWVIPKMNLSMFKKVQMDRQKHFLAIIMVRMWLLI